MEETATYEWAVTLPGANDEGGVVAFYCQGEVEIWLDEGDDNVKLCKHGIEIDLGSRTKGQFEALLAGMAVRH